MQCNLQMMSTGADDAFVLQRALIDICGRPAGAKAV